MTHAEDVRRVWADTQRMKRALLLAREAQKQLDAMPKPLPSKEEADARKKLTLCPAVHEEEIE